MTKYRLPNFFKQGNEWAGLMFATYNVVCFLVAFAIPWFANNVSRKAVHAVCLTLGGLGLISTMFATNPYFLIIGMIGVGIAWASILAMPYVILAGAIKPERMGVYMGVFNLFIVIPQIVMSFLIPQIYDRFLGGNSLNVVILGGISMLIAAVSVFLVNDIGQINSKATKKLPCRAKRWSAELIYKNLKEKIIMQFKKQIVALLLLLSFSSTLFAQQTTKDFSKETARTSPNWVKDAVIYEIFPRQYSQKGDFNSITNDLDRLKNLGVTVLWLMPIHPIGQEKKKGTIGSPYAVKDFYAINPDYGTKDDLQKLISEAHKRGLKVIIDIVANHTAWDSVMMKNPAFYTKNDKGEIIPPVADWADVADLNYDNRGTSQIYDRDAHIVGS